MAYLSSSSADDFPPPLSHREAAVLSNEAGKSNLLVSMAQAMNQYGEVNERRIHRTILPIPPELLVSFAHGENVLETYAPFFNEQLNIYIILIEYSHMQEFLPTGVYCLPSWDDIREWHGVIFVRHGLYRGGIFRFILIMDEEYPRTAPQLKFISKVFHPLVDPFNGNLDISAKFEKWNGKHNYILMILTFMKSIFYNANFFVEKDNNFNQIAATLYRDNKKTFMEEIKKCVELSQEKSLDCDPDFACHFSEYHRQHKLILAVVKQICEDKDCYNAVETFIDWFLHEYTPSTATVENQSHDNEIHE